jgi:hypothetical protein
MATFFLARRYTFLSSQTARPRLMFDQGISLTVDQYKAFVEVIPAINAALIKAGINVSGSAVDNKDDYETETKPQKKIKAKKGRSNIEATSEEDE